MKKRANNYLLIIAVLLFVVAVIVGAGLCYISWSDDSFAGADAPDTEFVGESAQSTESTQTTESAQGAEPTSAPTAEPTPEPTAEPEGLAANTVGMEQILITEDGEYQYIQGGQVASKKGIDVSKYQKDVDWAKVAADGVEYAFIRVGCRGYGSSGSLIKDEKFHQNVKGALQAGLDVGAYFFSQAITKEEAVEEAELVIAELEGYEITYPVAIDIERIQGQTARQDALTKEERTEICIIFCELIREAGYIPMVYGDGDTFLELLDAEQLAEYDFWVCETGGTMTFPYEFSIWQYAHTGQVSGINTDTNISISFKEW